MPIEIKELLIRAFVGSEKETQSMQDKPRARKAIKTEDTVNIVSNMLKQKNER